MFAVDNRRGGMNRSPRRQASSDVVGKEDDRSGPNAAPAKEPSFVGDAANSTEPTGRKESEPLVFVPPIIGENVPLKSPRSMDARRFVGDATKVGEWHADATEGRCAPIGGTTPTGAVVRPRHSSAGRDDAAGRTGVSSSCFDPSAGGGRAVVDGRRRADS